LTKVISSTSDANLQSYLTPSNTVKTSKVSDKYLINKFQREFD